MNLTFHAAQLIQDYIKYSVRDTLGYPVFYSIQPCTQSTCMRPKHKRFSFSNHKQRLAWFAISRIQHVQDSDMQYRTCVQFPLPQGIDFSSNCS
jgi:hypothetical protein